MEEAATGRGPTSMCKHAAFGVWDSVGDYSLRKIRTLIHDGVPSGKMKERAGRILDWIESEGMPRPREGDLVVEVGPGLGYLMEEMNHRTGCSIVGVDVSPAMAHKCLKRLGGGSGRWGKGNYRVVSGNGIELPSDIVNVDYVYSFATVLHIPKPQAYFLIMNVTGRLSEDGVAVFSFPDWSELAHTGGSRRFKSEVFNQVKGGKEDWFWIHWWSKEEIEWALEASGAEVVHWSFGQDCNHLVCWKRKLS